MPRNDAKRTNNNNNKSNSDNNTKRLPILVKKITKSKKTKKKINNRRKNNNRIKNKNKNTNNNNNSNTIIIKQQSQQQQQEKQYQHQQHELNIIDVYQRSNYLNGDLQKNWIDKNLNFNQINNCKSVESSNTCDVENLANIRLKYFKPKVTRANTGATEIPIFNANSDQLKIIATTTKQEYFKNNINSSLTEDEIKWNRNNDSNIVTNTNNNNNNKILETVASSTPLLSLLSLAEAPATTSSTDFLPLTTTSSSPSSASSSSYSSLISSPPFRHCLSTLYPIVIESPPQQQQSFLLGHLKNIKTKTTTTTIKRYLKISHNTKTEEKHSRTTTPGSLNVACHHNSETETETETTTTATIKVREELTNSITNLAAIAAAEQLLEHQEKNQQQQQQKQNVLPNNNKRKNNNRRRRQQNSSQHTPPEVKARLATLRTRKNIIASNNNQQQQQQQLEQQPKGHNDELEQTTLHTKGDNFNDDEEEKNFFEENCIKFEKNIKKDNNKEETLKDKEKKVNTLSCKRVFPQQLFDVETLNRIETLNDNEVKKANNNKRKRNQTAALLLGLNNNNNNSISGPGRSKRITTVAATAAASAAAAAAQQHIVSDKHFSFSAESIVKIPETRKHLSLNRDFLKPLPIEAANTNSKKRPRIMSLYERPYQTSASDGRGGGGGGSAGNVVGNGYMSTSRSSSSGGGGGGGGSGVGSNSGGGALIMNDSNDPQDLVANQYYLSGSSGSGIAGNQTTSSVLLGNGSAISHAPTTMGTLCNIGNTCYLNSVVYTLRFAPQFLHNLHHLLADLNALQQNIARARAKSSSLGRGISAVHMENARSWSSKDLASMEQYSNASASAGVISNNTVNSLGSTNSSSQVTQKSSHQVLTEKLHELYQSLYRNEMSESSEPHHADTLLHAIQDVSTIFEGNQQQDAHEFLMCVLNSIRETSQTLLKAIAECPDVILNGYIANPEDTERELKHSQNSITGVSNSVSGLGHTNMGSGSSSGNMSVALALSSLTSNSKSSLFFSRKSKRKDETKNSKNTRLQSPLKDNQIPGGGGSGVTGGSGSLINQSSNSHFYLNANDLNLSSAASTSPPATGPGAILSGVGGGVTSPTNSSGGKGSTGVGGPEDVDNLALLLKDKQRLELKIRELGLDFFNEDFEGITVSTTKCLSCETVTEQKETMIDIAVPVPQSGYESNELTDRPSSFIQNSCITREYFRNENKYRCEQCCGYTEAIRSISYEVLPRLLIIQLSRFSGGMEKINSYIPTSFTLQCFCSKCCELSDANKLHIYKLYSVITHVGATMSVGHYIAYTCSLDWANEYINCPKEQRRRASQERAAAAAAAAATANAGSLTTAGGANGGNGTLPLSATAGSSSHNSSSVGLGSGGSGSNSSNTSSSSFMKIMKFGRNKASSSGDMSKNVKHLNGLTSSSKAITNGIGKLTMNNSNSSPNSSGGGGTTTSTSGSQSSSSSNSPCQSINCCAMRLTAQQQLHYLHTSNPQLNAHLNDFGESETSAYATHHHTNANYNNNINQNPYTAANSSSVAGGYGSTGRGASAKTSFASSSSSHNHNGSEPIWYMCDDDKIKPMSQREFEELLSPARKITITPYLLFYARYNLQTTSAGGTGGTGSSVTPPKSASAATMSSSSPGPVSSSPQASWSNESLQSSGHSAHSGGGGIRM